jgi:hypothetical protein
MQDGDHGSPMSGLSIYRGGGPKGEVGVGVSEAGGRGSGDPGEAARDRLGHDYLIAVAFLGASGAVFRIDEIVGALAREKA